MALTLNYSGITVTASRPLGGGFNDNLPTNTSIVRFDFTNNLTSTQLTDLRAAVTSAGTASFSSSGTALTTTAGVKVSGTASGDRTISSTQGVRAFTLGYFPIGSSDDATGVLTANEIVSASSILMMVQFTPTNPFATDGTLGDPPINLNAVSGTLTFPDVGAGICTTSHEVQHYTVSGDSTNYQEFGFSTTAMFNTDINFPSGTGSTIVNGTAMYWTVDDGPGGTSRFMITDGIDSSINGVTNFQNFGTSKNESYIFIDASKVTRLSGSFNWPTSGTNGAPINGGNSQPIVSNIQFGGAAISNTCPTINFTKDYSTLNAYRDSFNPETKLRLNLSTTFSNNELDLARHGGVRVRGRFEFNETKYRFDTFIKSNADLNDSNNNEWSTNGLTASEYIYNAGTVAGVIINIHDSVLTDDDGNFIASPFFPGESSVTNHTVTNGCIGFGAGDCGAFPVTSGSAVYCLLDQDGVSITTNEQGDPGVDRPNLQITLNNRITDAKRDEYYYAEKESPDQDLALENNYARIINTDTGEYIQSRIGQGEDIDFSNNASGNTMIGVNASETYNSEGVRTSGILPFPDAVGNPSNTTFTWNNVELKLGKSPDVEGGISSSSACPVNTTATNCLPLRWFQEDNGNISQEYRLDDIGGGAGGKFGKFFTDRAFTTEELTAINGAKSIGVVSNGGGFFLFRTMSAANETHAAGTASGSNTALTGVGTITTRNTHYYNVTGNYSNSFNIPTNLLSATTFRNQPLASGAMLKLGVTNPNALCPGSTVIAFDNTNQNVNEVVTVDIPSNENKTGDITGSGGVRKRGIGKLTLSGDNTFTGDIIVEEGEVEVMGNPSNMPRVMVSSGAKYTANSNQTVSSTEGMGEIAVTTGMTLTLENNNNANNTAQHTGPGRRRKRGSGNATLSNPLNNYSGDTVIEEGCLIMTNASSMGAFPAPGTTRAQWLQIQNGGCLLVDNATVTGRRITFPVEAGTQISGNTTIRVRNGTFNKLSAITETGGAANLTIDTDQASNILNTLRLRGNNTYTGTTTVDNGMVLDIDNPTRSSDYTNNIINSNVTVNGHLRGHGQINGNVTINQGGLFSPGGRPGDLLEINGNLIINSGGRTFIDFTNSTTDTISLTGTLTIGDDCNLYLIPFTSGTTTDAGLASNFISGITTRTGTFNTPILMPTDDNPNNGVDNLVSDQYPSNITYPTGIVRLAK